MARLLDIDEVAREADSDDTDHGTVNDASHDTSTGSAHHLEKIPRNIDVKKRFEDHYRELLGENYEKFMNYSTSYIRKCIRVNTLKIDVESVKRRLGDRWTLEPIPWCREGFWITFRDGKRFDIGNLIEHHLGYIYVQESASMIPPVVLDPRPGETVLDMCAAPGSKTTQMAMYMKNKGILIANDISGSRLKALGMNMLRCGIHNSVLTMMQETRFSRIAKEHHEFRFDKILVDAPCSGTGTIRKSLKTIIMWNPLGITKLNRIQRNLLEAAFNMLKIDGTLVYSTCTIEPEENEVVVSYLLDNYPNARLEEIDAKKFGIINTPAVLAFDDLKINPAVSKCLRIHPYDNDTEGFFVAKIRRVS